MFHSTKANVMENEGGIVVEVLGRTGMRYTEAGRSVDVDSEVLATPEIAVYAASIKKWNDGAVIDGATRDKIVQNIKEAIRSQGEDIVVM